MRTTPAIVLAACGALVLSAAVGHAQSKPIEFKLDGDVWDPGKKKGAAAQEDSDEIKMPEEVMEKPARLPPKKGKKGISDDEIDIVTPEGGEEEPAAEEHEQAKPVKAVKEEKKAPDAGAAPSSGAQALAPDAGASPLDAGGLAAEEKKEEERPKVELLVIPTGTVADLYAHWEARRKALAARDFASADSEIKAITTMRLDMGARNFFRISSALVQESRHAMKARDWGMALALAKAAVDLAPDDAAAHLHQAHVVWSQNRSEVVVAARHAVDAARAAMEDPPTRVMITANLVMVFGGGLVLALVLFVAVMLFRYGRLAVHDLSHLFPRGSPRLFTGAIMACALFLPVVLGAGLIPVLFFWIAVVWIYATKREQILLGAALAGLAALPFCYPSLAVLLDQGESDAATIYRALRDGDARTDVEAAIVEAKGGSRDGLKLLAAGLWLKRTGRYAEAEQMLKAAESVVPKDPVALVDLGNLYLVQDRFQDALNAYNAALATDPQNVLAHYNLSKLFFRKGDLDKGHRENAEAARFNPSLADALAAVASPSINRFVADAEPDTGLLLDRFYEKGSPRRVLIAGLLERRTLGDFGRGDVPYFFAAAVAALVALNLGRRRIQPSVSCEKCGRASCVRCNPENTSAKTCGQCFHVYVRKDVPDPKLRNLKEFEVRRHTAKAANVMRAASVVVPGSGQILNDAPVAGMSILVFCGTVALFILLRGGPMPAVSSDLGRFLAVAEYAAGAAAALVYGLSVRAVFRRTG